MRAKAWVHCAFSLAGLLLFFGGASVPARRRETGQASRFPQQGASAGSGREQSGKAVTSGRVHRRRRSLVTGAAVATIVAFAGLGAGLTSALMSAQQASGANSFTAATVTLTSGSQTGTCTDSAVIPGSSDTCSMLVTYAGSVPAWMGLDVFVATNHGAAAGAEDLYNPGITPTDSPADIKVFDDQSSVVTYTDSASASNSLSQITCPSSGPLDAVNYSSYDKCFDTLNFLVNKSAFTNAKAVTFKISISVPTANGTNYQGGSLVVVIRPHVTQEANNGTTASCTAGSTCSGINHWS